MSETPIVFVVDDDASVRKALERAIRSVGLEVKSFASPTDFLAHTLPDRPACVVLDLRMPGASGLSVQERLAGAGNEIPIVFLSGHADVASSVRAMKAGAADFLLKPVDDQRVIDAVQGALREAVDRRHARAERARIEAVIATLTPREREVLALMVAGMPNKLIADRLKAAEKTIKVHRARVMEKTRAGSLAELVIMSQVIGIVGGPRPPEAPARPAPAERSTPAWPSRT